MWPPYDCTVEIYRAARERKAKPLLCVIRLLNNWFLLTNSCSQYQLGRLLNEWASWAQFPPPRFVQKDIYGITWDQALFIYLFFFLLLCFFASLARELQYSSQIVETGAICLEFSPNFLHSRFTPLFSLKCAALLPQCWAEGILAREKTTETGERAWSFPNEPAGKGCFGRERLVSNKGKLLKIASRFRMEEGKIEIT